MALIYKFSMFSTDKRRVKVFIAVYRYYYLIISLVLKFQYITINRSAKANYEKSFLLLKRQHAQSTPIVVINSAKFKSKALSQAVAEVTKSFFILWTFRDHRLLYKLLPLIIVIRYVDVFVFSIIWTSFNRAYYNIFIWKR